MAERHRKMRLDPLELHIHFQALSAVVLRVRNLARKVVGDSGGCGLCHCRHERRAIGTPKALRNLVVGERLSGHQPTYTIQVGRNLRTRAAGAILGEVSLTSKLCRNGSCISIAVGPASPLLREEEEEFPLVGNNRTADGVSD